MKPKPRVKLVGRDGNAFFIIGACRRALKDADYSPEDIKAFCDEAMSGDYNHVLQTAMKWCNVS